MNGARELESELTRSCESAGRLLRNLAEKLNGVPAMRSAAQYWQEHSARDFAVAVNRAVLRNPAPVIAVVLVTGFLLGRALELRRNARPDWFPGRNLHRPPR